MKRTKRCSVCHRVIRHWNKSGLCYSCVRDKTNKEISKMKKENLEKTRMEVIRLREYEEAYHVLFEHFPLLDLDIQREITNNLNSIFIINDWEKIN